LAVNAPNRPPATPHVPGLLSECDAQRWDGTGLQPVRERVAEEVAVSLNYNGLAHAVMMVSPADLEDFALGFSLTEGIIDAPGELHDVEIVALDEGVLVRMRIDEARAQRVEAQRRNVAGRTGCGLCGAETIEHALRHPHTLPDGLRVPHRGLHRAFAALAQRQTLNALTGAVHAAAWADAAGELHLVREDVGRHNALDKLIGALLRADFDAGAGFALITSRASFEMAQKAAIARIPVLAAISAPTALAVRLAQAANLTLVGFARGGRHNVYSHAQRLAA
jgi:FdhD protein